MISFLPFVHVLKVNGYTFRGNNSHFIVASRISWSSLIKERICSHQSKFFPLGVDPFEEDFILQVSKQEVTKLLSFCKPDGKDVSVSIHFKRHMIVGDIHLFQGNGKVLVMSLL